jgi:NADH-quinone oxidoreductase subunit E
MVIIFFTYFTLKHDGKHVVKVCDGIACHVKNNALKDKPGLKKLNIL